MKTLFIPALIILVAIVSCKKENATPKTTTPQDFVGTWIFDSTVMYPTLSTTYTTYPNCSSTPTLKLTSDVHPNAQNDINSQYKGEDRRNCYLVQVGYRVENNNIWINNVNYTYSITGNKLILSFGTTSIYYFTKQ